MYRFVFVNHHDGLYHALKIVFDINFATFQIKNVAADNMQFWNIKGFL